MAAADLRPHGLIRPRRCRGQARFQGLSYLVLGVGLLLWGAAALLSPKAGLPAGSAQPRQAGARPAHKDDPQGP